MTKSMLIPALAAVLLPSLAKANEDRPDASGVAVAPENAWELSVGQGYNQGFGRATNRGSSLSDFARAGGSVQLGFGYRVDPRLMLGAYAEGASYFANGAAVPDGTKAYSAALGLEGNWHFLPFGRIDPWLGLGGGLRAYWVDRPDAGTEALYGWDMARLRLGADFRVGSSASIGPVLGASLTMFVNRHRAHASVEDIADPGLSTFVFGGFQGRFEIGGKRISKARAVSARR